MKKKDEIDTAVIERANYIIAYRPMTMRGGAIVSRQIMVCVRLFKSQSFENCKRRALAALRAENVSYTGKGSVSIGLDPAIVFDSYLVYTEPMGIWERMMESGSHIPAYEPCPTCGE